MKNALNALILSFVAFSLVSCCSTCGKKTMPATEAAPAVQSYGKNYVAPVPVPEVADSHDYVRPDCVERYDYDGYCSNNTEGYAERATTQGWDGNPFIGLVPTMKPLAE